MRIASELYRLVKGLDNFVVSAFTKLGSDAPAIKFKELTGTTANVEGGSVSIAHGLTSTKIIKFSCIVFVTENGGINQEHTEAVGYQFHISFDANYIYITNHTTNSENILSKPFVITIIYKE